MKARVIAFYLPQYHPIPENDKWWGKGFTEWTNVAKAKPLFKGHNQPRIPADLGFYDLRVPEVREEQARMAREAGIEGFCYWHYWFDHEHKLLERPFQEVLASGKPDYPFCLGWANHSWTNKSWEAGTRQVKEQTLMQMVYNEEEYRLHFADVLPAFKDKRYMQIDGKPIFVIWDPLGIPDIKKFIQLWQQLALENGLKGIYFIGCVQNIKPEDKTIKHYFEYRKSRHAASIYQEILDSGVDAVNAKGYDRGEFLARPLWDIIRGYLVLKLFNRHVLRRCNQQIINEYSYVEEDGWENVFPSIMPGWDRSPRSGKKSYIHTNSTPEVFEKNVQDALRIIEKKEERHRILFLWSWNEWAEGSYMEPDRLYGHGFLNILKEKLFN